MAVCVLAIGLSAPASRAQLDPGDFMVPRFEPDDPKFPVCKPGKACDELPNINWAKDIHAAIETAQVQKKPVLIVFSARQQEPGLDDDF